jgi:membrane protease YdiL (CAAX protease family)
VAVLGDDLTGGWFRRLYWPSNPAGLGLGLLFAAMLLVLFMGLQMVLSAIVAVVVFDGLAGSQREVVKATLLSIFPASLITAATALVLARVRGGVAAHVLSLRWPRLSIFGWIMVVAGFLLSMYAVIIVIVTVLGIDLAQYTPGPHGETPDTGSAGLVKEAMFDIANEPWLFWLTFPSVALGAPIAEEFIFRGQLFSALSQTRLGVSGATIITSALWAGLHMSEPWLSVGIIFIMGLVFGWMMYRFGSLWVTMACHGVWNTVFALVIFSTIGGAP